jgi:hypothetical protein
VVALFKHGNAASASEECGEFLDLEAASFSRRILQLVSFFIIILFLGS